MRKPGPYGSCFLLAFLLAACGGGDNEARNAAQPIAQVPAATLGEPSQPHSASATPAAQTQPRRASTNPVTAPQDTLAGVDSNGDGVRDDIEKLVTDFDVSPDGRKAVLQLARATQVALTTSTSEEAARRNGALMVRAQACLASQVPDFTTTLSAVRAQTLNTDLRRLAWQAFEEKIARLEFAELQGAICQ